MKVKSKKDLQIVRGNCKIALEILKELVDVVEPGIDGYEVDQRAIELCKKHKVKPAFKDYRLKGSPPYPNAVDFCINNEVVHAITEPGKMVKKGDLVTVDFGIVNKDFYTDNCVTVGIKKISEKNQKLIETAKLAVTNSIHKAVVGNTTGDIGFTMHSVAKLAGFDVVKHYIGHGIGKSLHEAPEIPAYGEQGSGAKLEPGMLLCLEAQVVPGSDQVKVAKDGWTVITKDGKNCAWFEYMVLVTEGKPEVLTDTRNWPLIV